MALLRQKLNQRILYVGTSESSLSAVRTICARTPGGLSNCIIENTESEENALKLLSLHTYGLLIVENNLQLIRSIRQELKNDTVRIILLLPQETALPDFEELNDLDIHNVQFIDTLNRRTAGASILSAMRAFEKCTILAEFQKKVEHRIRRRTEDLEKANVHLKNSINTIEEDLEAGRRIQYRMLPDRMKKIGRYEFSRTLLSSTTLSGDFVDYFKINDSAIGFYIADVSGHGISSAFFTVLLTNFMHTFLRRYRFEKSSLILHPGNLLRRLNGEFLRENFGKYVTMFYGILNTEENKLLFSNAGQFPCPIVYSTTDITMNLVHGWKMADSPLGAKYAPHQLHLSDKTSHAAQIKSKGPPIGLFTKASFKEYEIKLPEEFVFLMLSDGILEILPYRKLDEKLKYLENVIDNFDIDMKSIIEKLPIYRKHQLPDDITLLMIRRRTHIGRS